MFASSFCDLGLLSAGFGGAAMVFYVGALFGGGFFMLRLLRLVQLESTGSIWCFLFVVVFPQELIVFVSSFSFALFYFCIFDFVLFAPLLCGES